MKISVQKIKNQLPATTFSHRAGIGHDWQQTHTRHTTSRCMWVTQLQLIVSRRRQQQQQQQQAKNNKPSALPTLRTCFLLHKPFTSFPLPKSCRMYFIFPCIFFFILFCPFPIPYLFAFSIFAFRTFRFNMSYTFFHSTLCLFSVVFPLPFPVFLFRLPSHFRNRRCLQFDLPPTGSALEEYFGLTFGTGQNKTPYTVPYLPAAHHGW